MPTILQSICESTDYKLIMASLAAIQRSSYKYFTEGLCIIICLPESYPLFIIIEIKHADMYKKYKIITLYKICI